MGFRRYTGLDLIRFRKFANELPELGNMELIKRYNLKHPEKTAKEQLTNLAIGLGLDDLHRKITGKDIPDGERWEDVDTSDEALPMADVGGSAVNIDELLEKMNKIRNDEAFKGVLSLDYPNEILEVIDALEKLR